MLCSFPFKGKAGLGMGLLLIFLQLFKPIPTLTLPLKGRESTAQIIS